MVFLATFESGDKSAAILYNVIVMQATWVLYAILSAVFAALVAIFGKLGVAKLDSTVATMIRTIVMTVFFVAVVLVYGKIHLIKTFDKRALLFVFLAGLAGAFSWLFYFRALQVGPVNGVAALDRLSVVFVFIFSLLFLGDQFTWRLGLGAALLSAGAILMS